MYVYVFKFIKQKTSELKIGMTTDKLLRLLKLNPVAQNIM